MKRMTGTSHKDQCTFMVISRSVILGMRDISDKRFRVNEHTFFFAQ